VPKGCYIQLERKAKEYILSNISSSFSVRVGLVSRLATFEEDSSSPLTIENFCEYYHFDIHQIYNRASFSRLCVEAGVKNDYTEDSEELLTKAFSRICAIDSRRWIEFLLNTLPNIDSITLTKEQEKMLNMMQFTIWQKPFEECGYENLKEGFMKLKNSPVMFSEMLDVLRYNYNKIDLIDDEVNFGFDCPLDLHCTYTRDQILVALDFMKPDTVREGVKYLPDKKTDIFFVTLNKADKDYSPTTMYNDYSINEWLFHWQSQSTTSAESPTGQRYIRHKETGNRVLLFVREFKKDVAGAAPYTFLGLADYVKHQYLEECKQNSPYKKSKP
jgi:hypothetical protein